VLLSHLLTGVLLALFTTALSLAMGASAWAAAAWYVVGGVIGVIVSVLVHMALDRLRRDLSQRQRMPSGLAYNSFLVTIRSYLAHDPKQR